MAREQRHIRLAARRWGRVVVALACSTQLGWADSAYTVDADVVWRAELEFAGTSSPRITDLNGDGTADVVVGAGVENRYGRIVALDGATGAVLWKQRVPDEVVTTTPLLDIDGDGTRDVFVGGRKRIRDVFALSGKTGQTLWQLTEANPETEFPTINFINLLIVGDGNDDGLDDLLIVQSGGADVVRPAARFHLVSSRDGAILSSGVSPDGRETYSLPIFERRPNEAPHLYVGTGGETLSGNVLKLRFPSLEEVWRLRNTGGGIVASPLLVDMEGDGERELIAASMNGTLYRFDSASGKVRWKWRDRPFWTYASPAAGSFNDDATLDVISVFTRGVWPHHEMVRVVWLDGATGRLLQERDFGEQFRFSAGSPLVVDLDHDGLDEVVIVVSTANPDSEATDLSNRLLVYDGGKGKAEVLSMDFDGASLSTPCLGDLDGDARLDVVHASRYGVMRIELEIGRGSETPRLPAIKWGEFRGENGVGIHPSARAR